jgi:hypothetical protein
MAKRFMTQEPNWNAVRSGLVISSGTKNAVSCRLRHSGGLSRGWQGAITAHISRARSCERFMMTDVLEGRLDADDEDQPSVIELVDLYPIAGIISLASYLLLS